MGAVFAHTAVLQRKPHNYDALFEIGRGFGGIMLLLDAYRDYEGDAQAGRFNAMAVAYPGEDWHLPARSLFRQFHHRIRDAFTALDLPNPALLNILLIQGLGKIGCHSLAMCHTKHTARPAGSDSPSTYTFIGASSEDDQPDIRDPFPEDNRLCSGCRSPRCQGCCGPRGGSHARIACWECGYWCHWPGSCDCHGCDCCRDCSIPECHCPDCSHCEVPDCSACCDCGNCDCGNCDGGGCDCNCG